jgi:hypothetical protein
VQHNRVLPYAQQVRDVDQGGRPTRRCSRTGASVASLPRLLAAEHQDVGRTRRVLRVGDFSLTITGMTAGAFVPAPPRSARLAQVYLSLVLAPVLAVAGVTLPSVDSASWPSVAVLISMAATLLLGMFALQAKHPWSWAASIIVLWLLAGSCAALGTFLIDEVEMHSNTSEYLLLGARVFVVAIPCGLPAYMTFVPRVRRRFRERAQLLEASRRHQAKP